MFKNWVGSFGCKPVFGQVGFEGNKFIENCGSKTMFELLTHVCIIYQKKKMNTCMYKFFFDALIS